MKNRIREHGDLWVIENEKKGKLLVTPEDQLGKEYAYQAWLEEGVDFEVVKGFER